jgi:sec-independent protein translocase protein TatA
MFSGCQSTRDGENAANLILSAMICPALPLAIFDLGGPEILLILAVVLIFFGGEKLPELARGLGKSIREFKKATAGIEEEFKRAIEEPPHPAAKPGFGAKSMKAVLPEAGMPDTRLDPPPEKHSDFEHGEN